MLTLLAFACNNEQGTDSQTEEINQNTDSPADVSITPAPPETSKVESNATPSITDSKVSTQVSSSNLNPPHGQPGHKCEIPVGAPLDSPPSATAAPSTPSATTTPVVTAPGMNPPHGEPGHDCKVPVGDPLPKK